MKKQSPTFEAEGMQPDYVRELLDAGRDAAMGDPAVRGYDVEAGLARHAALVQAGAPVPPWAQELVAAGAGASAGAGTATVAKLATGKLVAGITLAVVTAGAIATMVIGGPDKSARVSTPAQPAPLAPVAPEAASRPEPVDPSAAPEQQGAALEGASAGEPVQLDIAPITARAKRDAQSAAQPERATAGDTKPARTGTAQSAKSLDALMEAVAKQQSSKGHTTLAPSDTVARSQSSQASQARAESPSESGEQASTATMPAPAPAPAPVVDDARLEREMGMLAVAQRVLKSDPERALRLAQQGEKEFAGSMFTQERQQVLLLALIELGRIGEAKRLALPYLKRWPNGPFSDRLRSALAAAKPEN